MFLSEEDFWFLVRNGLWIFSLAICLVLLAFPIFRRRSNPLAWLVCGNLVAGAVWYAQYPLGQLQTAWFTTADPGYAADALHFDGNSLYIADPAAMRKAAYSCYSSYSSGLCEMPVGYMLKHEQVDFVEIGTDPIYRYSIVIHDPRCVDWDDEYPTSHFENDFVLTDRYISPGLGACIVREAVDAVTASHEISVTRKTLTAPSGNGYLNVQLRNRATGQLLDQFDGWYDAHPYLSFDPPTESRRPLATLADLLMIRPGQSRYDRAGDDALLAQYGVDEDILIRAAASPYQSLRAQTIWLACRDHVVAQLSAPARAALTEASRDLFEDNPAWIYPESCADWAR